MAPEALAGEGRIVTAGGIDTHVHYIHPECAEVALENGITTLVGGGTGPVDGTNAVTSTPGPWNIKKNVTISRRMASKCWFIRKR